MSYQFCHSEEEARGKLCPSSMNRTFTSHCRGSECMGWRWVETRVADEKGNMIKSGDTHGYCGLAGPPWRK